MNRHVPYIDVEEIGHESPPPIESKGPTKRQNKIALLVFAIAMVPIAYIIWMSVKN